MADAPLTRGALAPGTSKDIVFEEMGDVILRGKEEIFAESNVEERRVLYGVPNKEQVSNVL